MRNKIHVAKEKDMSATYITEAKTMAGWLLKREHRGPGDTIEAAAYRLQTKYGVPVSVLMRLRHREVRDMLVSNFLSLSRAYQSATERMERAYEHEKAMAVNPHILRLASLMAGTETDEGEDK